MSGARAAQTVLTMLELCGAFKHTDLVSTNGGVSILLWMGDVVWVCVGARHSCLIRDQIDLCTDSLGQISSISHPIDGEHIAEARECLSATKRQPQQRRLSLSLICLKTLVAETIQVAQRSGTCCSST